MLTFSQCEQDLFPDGVIHERMSVENVIADIGDIVQIEQNHRRILYEFTDTALEMRKQHNELLGVVAVKKRIIDAACGKLTQDLEDLEWLIPSSTTKL